MSETQTLGYKASKLEEKLPSLLEGQEKLEKLDLDEYCLECLENNRQYANLWNLSGIVSTGHYQKTIRGHLFTICRLAYPESEIAIDVYPDGFTKIVNIKKKTIKNSHLWEAWAHKAKKTIHPRRRIYGSKPPPFFRQKDLVKTPNYIKRDLENGDDLGFVYEGKLDDDSYQKMTKKDRHHAGRIGQWQEALNKAHTYEERVKALAKLDQTPFEAFSVTKKVSYKQTLAGKKWCKSKIYKDMVKSFKTPVYVETHKKISKYS